MSAGAKEWRSSSRSIGILTGASAIFFSTGAGAPPPARPFADTSPRIHSPRLGVAAGAFPLALGPHPQRDLSLTPRLGFTVLGSVRPRALFHWRWGPTPSATFR